VLHDNPLLNPLIGQPRSKALRRRRCASIEVGVADLASEVAG